jgi:molecular chaperone GrpE
VPDPTDPPAQPPDEGDGPDPRDAELADLRERLARARADYDNLQKRVARDAGAERERAKARVLDGLLALNELAHMAAHQALLHPGPLSDGVILLAREFSRMLEREGLTPIDAVGVPFDAGVHEAVARESVPGAPAGLVVRIIQPGYRLDGRVLRYAKVAVATGDGPGSGGAGDGDSEE